MDCSTPGLPLHQHLPERAQDHAVERWTEQWGASFCVLLGIYPGVELLGHMAVLFSGF